MTVEDFNAQEPVEIATTRNILPKLCTGWGIASAILGIVTALVMYSRISAGKSVDDDTGRGLTTFAAAAVIVGMMGFLAGKVMNRVEVVRRMQVEILERMDRMERKPVAPHLGTLVGQDVGAMLERVSLLRRDHDELSEEVCRLRPTNVTQFQRPAPINGSS